MTSMGGIERFFLCNSNLPAMPEVARQVVACFDDAAVDLATLVQIAGRDPEVAARVVRFAGTPARGGFAAASLSEAAARLGAQSLRDHVLAASIASAFPRVPDLEPLAFWKHCLATAGTARVLAPALGAEADGAYLAGLLVRAGQLLLARMLPQVLQSVESSLQEPGGRARLERLAIGTAHADMSAEVARRWRLPQRLVDGLAGSVEPLEATPFSPLAAALDLAGTVSDAAQLGVDPVLALASVRAPLLQRLQLEESWLRERLPSWGSLTDGSEALFA